jgi:hypothetical protein
MKNFAQSVILLICLININVSYSQEFTWAKSIRGQSTTEGADLCVDSQGNIIITGSYSFNTDFLFGSGVVNATGPAEGVYLAKYTFDGTLIWVKGIDIGYYNNNKRYKVNVNSNDEIYLAGSCQPYRDFDPSAEIFNTLSSTAFLAKYTSTGDFVFAQNVGDAGVEFSSFTIDNNDNIIITGAFNGIVDFDSSPFPWPQSSTFYLNSSGANNSNYGRLFVLKVNSLGGFVFAQNFGSSSSGLSQIDDVETNSLNEIIVITKLESGPMNLMGANPPLTNSFGEKDIFLIKIPSNGGASLWYRQIDASFPTGEGFKLDVNENDEILITGHFGGLFNLIYWGSTSLNLSSQLSMDLEVCIIKASSSGNLIWAKKLTGAANVYASDIESNQNGDIYITGEYLWDDVQDYTFGGVQVFGNYTYTAGHGFYILKISSSGVPQFVRFLDGQINEPGGPHPTNIALSPDENTIFTMGSYSFDNFDVDPGTLVSNMGSAGVSDDVFLHAMCEKSAIATSATLNICEGSDILLQTSTIGGTYNWSGPNGFTSNVQNPTISNSSILNSGTYNLTINYEQGCQLNTTTGFLQVYPPSSMVANTTTEFCEGESVVMATISSYSSFNVSGPNGYNNIGYGNTIAINPVTAESAGQYNITSTNNGGCVINAVFNIINVKPAPVITIDASDVDICLGESLVLTASGGSNITWVNNVTNGVSFSPLDDATYIASGFAANGCEGNESIFINTSPLPTVSHLKLSDNSNCSGSCNGSATVFPINGALTYTYLWDNNATNPTSATTSGLCSGLNNVQVTTNEGCSIIETVQINQIVESTVDPNVYLTNLAAIDQVNVSPSFAAYYSYNLPSTITPNPSNPRNFVDPGKKARFKIECTNQKVNGQSIVSGICKVRTNSLYVNVTDSTSALNNIGWNGVAWSADEFEIDIDPNTPAGTNIYIDFIVQESGSDYSTKCISIPIAPLSYSPTSASTIDDDNNPDSQGNDNDACEPGETIEFYPWLDNISTLNAEYVRGRFENLDNHSFINIWNDVPGTGTTVYDASWWNYAFAQPQIINSSSINTTPEYDFVFDYASSNIINDFKLYMVMSGGFKLFSGNALSLVQWTLPYTFNVAGGPVSVYENAKLLDQFIIYPNPTTTSLTLKVGNYNSENLNYKLYDGNGRTLTESKIYRAETAVSMETLPAGSYFLKVSNGKSEMQTLKIIKNN